MVLQVQSPAEYLTLLFNSHQSLQMRKAASHIFRNMPVMTLKLRDLSVHSDS